MKGRIEFTSSMEFPAPGCEQIDMARLQGEANAYKMERARIAVNLARVEMMLTPTQWKKWLRAEFGWTDEMAAFLMKEI